MIEAATIALGAWLSMEGVRPAVLWEQRFLGVYIPLGIISDLPARKIAPLARGVLIQTHG